MKLLLTALALIALAMPVFGQSTPSSSTPATESTQQAPQDQQAPTFRSNVNLVNVFATVTDANGAPIATLKKDDFRIFEDGIEQKIAVFNRESELPLSIAMGIDTSLSTKKDLPLELESARKFARSILRPIDGLGLYEFSEVVNEVQPFTSDLKKIDRGIARVQQGAATAMYDYIYLASESLTHRQGRKVMVLITDGGDTVSKISYKEAVRAAQIAEAIVYPIIMVPIEASAGRDLGGEHALIQLARDTGGKHYYATSLPQLDQAFAQISDELRTQYLVAYYPSRRAASSDFRRIQITIDPNTKDTSDPTDLKIRYRTGYYTSKLD